MPATPAWPPKSLPRLFVRAALGDGAEIDLDPGQANYLGNVLRLKEDDEILVFLPRYVRRWGHVVVMPRTHAPRRKKF